MEAGIWPSRKPGQGMSLTEVSASLNILHESTRGSPHVELDSSFSGIEARYLVCSSEYPPTVYKPEK